MMKVSKLADYAVVVVATLGNKAERMNAAGIAKSSGLPEPTVAKVLKLLAKAGVVVSTQGPRGGYELGRAAEDITVLEVVKAVDGPISVVACVGAAEEDCDYETCCPVKGRWGAVNGAIHSALENVTLADMLRNPFMDDEETRIERKVCV